MKIACPICSMPIEITKEHIGRKGRCSRCESKFVIPENTDDAFEILHCGRVSQDVPKRKRPLVVPHDDPLTRRTPRSVYQPKSSSSAGAIIMAIVVVAIAVGGFAVFKRKDAPRENATKPTPEVREPVDFEALLIQLAAKTQEEASPSPGPGEIDVAQLNNAGAPEILLDTEETEPPPTPASIEEELPRLTEKQKATALSFLQSNRENKRRSAFAAFRKIGDNEKSTYLKLLAEAREHHSNALGDRALKLSTEDNPLSQFAADHASWIDLSKSARKMAQTNWKDEDPDKYRKKHSEMDDAFDEAARSYKRVIRSAKRAEGYKPSELRSFVDILAEFDREMARCENEVLPDLPSLRDEIAKSDRADRYIKSLDALGAAIEINAAHETAEEHNSRCRWANRAYKIFASILNERRVALGLVPLRLDEKLSDACGAHSKDMAAHGYFSHTGLTPETRTFGRRAKGAGFTGSPTGECIYVGSTSPMSAHQAWWYSDGHRLIMYANNPNTLGLGLHGTHWTLNTGKKGW